MQEEFYIGWQATAPPGFAKVVRRFVIGLGLLIPLLALLLVFFQKGFSNGRFEYGKTTELEGIYTRDPVPFLTVENRETRTTNQIPQKILLVGPGKFGFEISPVRIPDGAKVKVAGFLIYNDGKTALQVENIVNTGEPISRLGVALDHPFTIARVTLRGEITDPKCLLGVMNPAQGKPHRDCAVRCIAGGIPPVLKVANPQGDTEYYLLVGPHGEPLHQELLPFVGDGVQICGQLEQHDDWLVLYADPATLRRINKGALEPGTMCN
ncbi:MAG: hypothetical protein ABIQ93_02400 [Saprospiraceae bacterium]